MSSVRSEVSVFQEGVDATVPLPYTAQSLVNFGGVDAPATQTVTISAASLQPLVTFTSVVDTIGDVSFPFPLRNKLINT